MPTAAISNYTLVNSLGAGTAAVLDALRHRRSGLTRCDFETVQIDTHIGRVPGLESYVLRSDLQGYDCRNNRLAQLALERDGFADAVRAARSRCGPARIGVFMGTSTSGLLETELAYRGRAACNGQLPHDFPYAGTHNVASLSEFVRQYFDLQGPSYVVSSACSSSAKVFGSAMRLMAAGLCDVAVVGGVDTLCLTTLYGFRSLELTSTQPCRPFDAARSGISIGEGAGFVLLHKAPTGRDKAMLLSVGESCDAHHMSAPHPEGLGARLALTRALEAAGLAPGDIDYINLHGTATRANDAAEDRAVCDVFGTGTPCSSTKGATGHLLGAAGATEAVIAMLAIEHGFIPGGAQTETVDPALRCNYQTATRAAAVRRVVSNSFGFGGSNCSLVFGAVA